MTLQELKTEIVESGFIVVTMATGREVIIEESYSTNEEGQNMWQVTGWAKGKEFDTVDDLVDWLYYRMKH